MKKFIYNKLGLLILLASIGVSCSDDTETNSIPSQFEPVSITVVDPTTVEEFNGTQTVSLEVVLGDNQLSDVSLTVVPGPSSTATEGVDFDILTDHIDLLAFQGQDTVTIDVVVYSDEDFAEEDETIYLKLVSDLPSGVYQEVLAITIPKWPNNCSYTLAAGPLSGTDITYWESEAVLGGTAGNYTITGLGVGWMGPDFWGEVIIVMNEVEFIVTPGDEYFDNVEIPEQTYMETTYNGAPQDPYLISGTGIISKCGKKIILSYTLSNYGVDWGAWFHDNGYISEDTFTAYLDIP